MNKQDTSGAQAQGATPEINLIEQLKACVFVLRESASVLSSNHFKPEYAHQIADKLAARYSEVEATLASTPQPTQKQFCHDGGCFQCTDPACNCPCHKRAENENQAAAPQLETAAPRPLCPKGHPVPFSNCKYCAMLTDIFDGHDSKEELIALIFKWHDAFYREENRANALAHPAASPVPQHEEELKLLKSVIAWANNSLYGSHGFFLSLNGGPPNEHHLDSEIEKHKAISKARYRELEELKATASPVEPSVPRCPKCNQTRKFFLECGACEWEVAGSAERLARAFFPSPERVQRVKCGGCGGYQMFKRLSATEIEVIHDCNAAPERVERPTPHYVETVLDKLRNDGWMVAVHNDYRHDGKLHTFWLFTRIGREGRFVKGEGEKDADALAQIMRQLNSHTNGAAPVDQTESAAPRDMK